MTKDKNIRRVPAELQALRLAKARHVFLSAKDMTGAEQAACLLDHWKTIESVVRSKPAPLIVTVTRTQVQWLKGDEWRVAKRKR